jgi:hypothetical protein
VVGLSFAAAWLRLKSGSVWTAALLHGSHNAFMLHVFDTLTTDTGSTWLLLGEYGAVTAVIGLLLAILFWSLRTRLPATNQTGAKKYTVESRPTPAPSEEAALASIGG